MLGCDDIFCVRGFDRGDKKGEKSLKLGNMQPIFWVYKGLVVVVNRGCGVIGEVRLRIRDLD